MTIRPIISMTGEHHFNEVVFDAVFVPDEQVVGTIGDGWAQVTSELAYERSGPERLLSTFVLLDMLADELAARASGGQDGAGPTWVSLSPLDVVTNTPVSYVVPAATGQSSLTYSVVSGLPPGLSFSANTSTRSRISRTSTPSPASTQSSSAPTTWPRACARRTTSPPAARR